MTIAEIENVLQTYTWEEILEYNTTTPEDVLLFLVESEYLELPDPRPL